MDAFKQQEMLNEFREPFYKYQMIIDYLIDIANEDGLSRTSQKEIGDSIGISTSLVSKCLRRLERSDLCVEKISPGVYKVNKTDTFKNGPYKKVLIYLLAITRRPDLIRLKYEEQAKLLKMSKEEIEMVRGYLSGYISHLGAVIVSMPGSK